MVAVCLGAEVLDRFISACLKKFHARFHKAQTTLAKSAIGHRPIFSRRLTFTLTSEPEKLMNVNKFGNATVKIVKIKAERARKEDGELENIFHTNKVRGRARVATCKHR